MPDHSKHASLTGKPGWWTSDDWATPPELVAQLEAEFGRFDLDPCARESTAKADAYYTIEDDGLVQPWTGHIFVNPPYSNPEAWIRKALAEIEADRASEVVMLLQAAIDTGWFHDLLLHHADIRFVRGRVKFLGWDGKPSGSPTAGSLIARLPCRADHRDYFHC